MKGRSYRLQSHHAAALADDWVDGSWTVDCVCGVNFDDGEEMVNCDDCGVWVHTRCSRYVKGDELFTCDKCKSSKNNHRNGSEETEVAQLLVELPTKTARLESRNAANGPARRLLGLWTDIPMEKRVHVQGIPGGDPSLFSGMSSVFTPQLWKCTGYVPKKFNFRYREFPCWDEKEEGNAVNEEKNLNAVDKGDGVLFPFSKENALATSAAALIHMRGKDEQAGCDTKVHSKQMKKREGEDAEVRHLQSGVKMDNSLLWPIVIQSGKQKSEELEISKDQSGNKKSRTADKEVDLKKKRLLDAKSVFTSTNDGKPLAFYEDRGLESFRNDSQSPKNKNLRGTIFQVCESDGCLAPGSGAENPKDNLAEVEHSSGALSAGVPGNIFLTGAGPNEGKSSHEDLTGFKNSLKVDVETSSALELDVGRMRVKQEEDNMPNGNPDAMVEGSVGNDAKPCLDELATVTLEVEDTQINGDCGMFATLQPNIKVEVGDADSRAVLNCPLSLTDAKDDAQTSSNSMAENCEQNDAILSGLPLSVYKAQETLEAINDCHAQKVPESTAKTCQLKQELDSSENAILMPKCPSELKHGLGLAEEPSKSSGTHLSSPVLSSEHKMAFGKSCPSSCTVMILKSSVSDSSRSADAVNSSPDIRQQGTTESNSSIKVDRAPSDAARDDGMHETSRKTAKVHPKSSMNSTSEAPNSSKIVPTSVPKRVPPYSKDSLLHSSCKSSLVQNSSETAGLLQNDGALHAKHKAPPSCLPLRSEKFNQANSQASSKTNHTLSMNPSAPANSPAALSDEELALLLHQELNSSPRVPRVPRVRHAGSLPQMASPTATNMLIRHTSSYGAKDSMSRRKKRDTSKDGFHRFHEPYNEDRKTDKLPPSPDQKRQDKGYAADSSSKREDIASPTSTHSVKRNIPTASTSTANSGPSSSTEFSDHRMSSVHSSPMHMSDEETGTTGGPVHRTLPGLINEIMSKGKHMTYEGLCNAVLPHWHNLRKHNGERYAYSSHSQAVLDCLRNRHEWARLVGRGPKTNSSKKRQSLDAEVLGDDGYGEGRGPEEGEAQSLEAQREEFPKGKRKARKRRRLALQGRGIKDVRKRGKSHSHPDDDYSGPISNSSEESLFSKDEIQGSRGGTVEIEASASSDEGNG